MLIVIPEYFSWPEYASVTISCLIGIVLLGAALTGYLIAPMGKPLRILLAVGAILIVAPSMETNLWGLALAAPVLVQQWLGWRRAAAPPLAA